MDLKEYIRSIPDYPKKGILFRDITTLIKDEKALRAIQCLCQMQLAIASQLNDGQFIDWGFTKP